MFLSGLIARSPNIISMLQPHCPSIPDCTCVQLASASAEAGQPLEIVVLCGHEGMQVKQKFTVELNWTSHDFVR